NTSPGPYLRFKMSSTEAQAILDAFYKPEFILMRERFYGKDYMSPGGEAAGKELLLRLSLRPGEKVLDIGCGTGGPATFMARHYGAQVHGLELSDNMIQLGQQRLNASEETLVKQRVKLEAADATTVQLEKAAYDVIYSRDTVCHIKDKKKLFENCMPALRSGGRVFISDFCRGDKEPPQEFTEYWKEKGFNISTFDEYALPLKAIGLKNIVKTDITNEIVNNNAIYI
ncbi:unnamed protein product, partial [Meganyctiphanes norvegica]